MPEEIDLHQTAGSAETAAPPGVAAQRASGQQARAPIAGSGRPAAVGPRLTAKQILLPLLFLVAMGAVIYFVAPHKSQHDRAGRPHTVPVSTATAVLQSVPIEIRTTGNIVPFSVVNVVPQVSGQLTKVYFTQGQTVKKGDLLFQIDPRPYKASLDQALGNVQKDQANIKSAQANMQRDQANIGQLQANLQKDQANLRYARVEADRYRRLVQQGAISMEQADQTITSDATATAQIEADKKQIQNAQAVVESDRAQIDTAKGTLEADKAVAENARIQLDWCTIHAPIDGRTGSLQIYAGNVVAANSATPLVTIAQVQPIYVQFTIPEEYLDQVRRCLLNNTLTIQAMIEGVATDYVSGTVTFMDNTVNTTSGTALLRASFANSDLRLYPGQFVDVRVSMPPPAPSVVVPVSAIQTTQQGNAVYIVGKDNKAQLVPVELARSNDDWAAITSGIEAGDTVVTDGQLQLMPGISVRIVPPGEGAVSAKRHGKPGAGQSPDAGFTSSSQDAGAPPSAGAAAGNSGWSSNQNPVAAGAKPGAPAVQSPLFNPASSGGEPFRSTQPQTTSGFSAAPAGGGAFHALQGAHQGPLVGRGFWHHRH